MQRYLIVGGLASLTAANALADEGCPVSESADAAMVARSPMWISVPHNVSDCRVSKATSGT
jgi:hypothetical protein